MIGKKFPHETDKLPLLCELLSKEDPQDKTNWQTRFVLTVWLSIVILTPFDLAKFDADSTEQSIAEKIYTTLIRSLCLHDSCQNVTAYCLAKFFARPDVLRSDHHLSEFISLTLTELREIKTGPVNSMDDVQLIGYLRTLAYMFKFLPREEMKKRCDAILEVLTKMDINEINRELVNHLIVKLIQRAGLSLLPKRIATWRYRRGSRILGQVSTSPANSVKPPASEQVAEEQMSISDSEDESGLAEHLESILNILFVAAHNSQTRVRWSASKGIARLSSRLSRERAGQVIDTVLSNFFQQDSSEFAWHSGCLTLAEMSRNGLILEEKLATVTDIIGRAILYDKIKGSFAVGAHVREGACYVCWAIARTYEEKLLQPYISSISVNLLCTMLFDRELQCRRAASATFQELVGRQGTYNEEGINILTNVDYQNVGQRQFSYLHLALQVAAHGEKYSKPFVEHLIDKKISHWDVQIRRIASDSLSALMLHVDHDFVRAAVLPRLKEMINQDGDNNMKHGGMLALAKIIRGLVPLNFEFDQELKDFVGGCCSKSEKQLKSKQQAPNFIEAIGLVISSAEAASFAYGEESEILKQWESIALSALDNDNPALRDIGSDALLTLYRTYYKGNKTQQDKLLTIYNRTLSSPNESSRCGALKALSKLSQALNQSSAKGQINLDAETPDIILMSLASYIAKETHEKSLDAVFAQAKAEACEAFVNFVRHLDKERLVVSTNLIQAGYEALLAKSQDYTFDKRGDIGVVVRRAAIKSLQELTLYLLSIGVTFLFDSSRVTEIMGRILQQTVSYNNSAREQAAQAFYRLLGANLPDDVTIAHKDEMLALLERYNVNDEFNWRDDSTPIFVALLSKPEYSFDLWTGLLPSLGQVSEICAKQFKDALSDYLRSLELAEREQVFASLMDTLEQKDSEDRQLTTGLVVLDYLLTEGLMSDISLTLQERLVKFCHLNQTPRKKTTLGADLKRLFALARVASSLLQFETAEIRKEGSQCCLTLLLNTNAKVRAYTAEQLYLALMTYREELVDAMELLSDTDWSVPLDKVKLVQEELSRCLYSDSKADGQS